MKKKTVEVLMSAMHQEDMSIIEKSNVNGDCLLVNQCDAEGYDEIKRDNYTWRMISSKERGSAQSRNLALENAHGDICKFCDDDEILVDNYEEIIRKAFEELPDAVAIVFNVNFLNPKHEYYYSKKIRRAPWYRGYGTLKICFRLDKINEYGIRFDTMFGSGSPFGGGEDILFIDSLRKNGLKVYEYPVTLTTVDCSEDSHWFFGYTEKYFYNQGAFLQRMYGNSPLKYLRICYDLLYKLRKDNGISKLGKYRCIRCGMKGYKDGITYEERE